MATIELVDVSMRDGNQSLWGATGLGTAHCLTIAPVLDRVGFRAADFTSSTHMGVAVRFFRENPWERIRLMHAAMPNTALQFITTGFRFISWQTAAADFMQLVYQRLVANGIGRFAVIDPMHDIDALLESARMIRIAGGREIVAGLTYTVSAIHDDAFYAGCARRLAASSDVDRIYIKDPAGLLTPERARSLIPAVQGAIGALPLELHTHCTIGLGAITCLAAAELGISTLHVAVEPLGSGTSLPSAQRMVANLRELGHTVAIDDRALTAAGGYFTQLARAEGLPLGAAQEFDAAFLRHQIPGGVVTTMQRQLGELKLLGRWPAVIEEVERVRAELGYPIMVTPFPQMVCTQALFNVIGTERYGNVPDELVRYVLGRFGRPTRPVDENVRERILSRPRAAQLAVEPPPPSLAQLRTRFGHAISDEELLLRAVMPGAQVDAMVSAGPARRHYNPELAPVLSLLRGLAGRDVPQQLVIEQPGWRLTLRRRPAPAPAAADASATTA
jgi:oxaloacetate decarboxylase (Na+ extruding) subunit alpha